MNNLISFMKAIGMARMAAMLAVAAGLIGFFAFLILRLTEPQMTMLFAELDLKDSSEIVRTLETRGVAYELRNDGATIMVPRKELLRLRMSLAENGLPSGGSVGYEIFDKSDALGTTSFVQNINHLRALEGELARTIRAIERVRAARVHLVLPQRELFAREEARPSASIVLNTRGDLSQAQIRAIQHLVASAVKNLAPTRVSIVDESGRLLAAGTGEEGPNAMVSAFEERRTDLERRLREQVEQIVTSVVGPDRARVNVTAEIDYNRITQTSDVYDPEGRVVRSTQTREENSASAESAAKKGVSVGNELPGANQTQADEARTSEQDTKSEEVVNYEISRTTKTLVTEAGRVKRVSVAVLVDGVYSKDQSGNLTYEPRSQEQLDQIATLVRSAVGFDRERGDQVEVVNLRFAEIARPLPAPEDTSVLSLTKDDYFYIAELAVLLVVAALVLLFVVRPLVRRIIAPEEDEAGVGVMREIGGPEGETKQLPGQAGQQALPPSRTSDLIDSAQASGAEQAHSIQRVGELVDAHPHEALNIVRQWIGEAA